METDPETEEQTDLLTATTSVPPRSRWAFWREKALVALTVAAFLPSPLGYWPPLSLILWGLVGDPRSLFEAAAFILGGTALLGAYTAIVFAILSGFQWGLWRAMKAMVASNRHTISELRRK